ncbi:PDZ domain containing protein [Nitzschia inconspicua]|uniref:PDZ domain containing protein n=1 Tax=Nitzschia inconspicua TaxID=303405 RepID=A0A9K3LKX0_9STRA|nr:PDZ domain containing protein [Nitzschia inconspicua]
MDGKDGTNGEEQSHDPVGLFATDQSLTEDPSDSNGIRFKAEQSSGTVGSSNENQEDVATRLGYQNVDSGEVSLPNEVTAQTYSLRDSDDPPTKGLIRRFDNLRKRISKQGSDGTSSATLASEAAATKAAKEEQTKKPSAVEMEMGKLHETDLESMRPSQISVTVIKHPTESYGLVLAQIPEDEKESVKIDQLIEEGLMHKTPLKVGDTLKTINSKKVTACDKVMEDLVAMDGPITLVAETPKGNPCVVQAFCRKPSKESLVGIGFHLLEHGVHKLLHISYLSPDGLLAHSSLSKGDIVLAINDIPCAEKSPLEAAALILESASAVSILALNPKHADRQHSGLESRAQKWLRGAKRVGIAIGGGTMVGVGLIFIPTLPPPFGEVLIVGGVSVLGTEFEAPKRLVRSTRDSLERAVGRTDAAMNQNSEESVSSQATSTDVASPNLPPSERTSERDMEVQPVTSFDIDNATLEAAVASTLDSRNISRANDQPKRTMQDRMKSFGRNYVLPFLDQVVGDRPHQECEVGVGTDAESPVVTNDDADSQMGDATQIETTENDSSNTDVESPGDVEGQETISDPDTDDDQRR